MKYYIKRDLNEYGPYTLADLQRYVAQGNIALSDLARSEGMTDWVPVSQVIGNIPVPVAAPAVQPAGYAGAQVYGGQPVYGMPAAVPGAPVPADFHWALVLLIGLVSCGIFTYVWLFVEAAFVRKIAPQSKGLMLMVATVVGIYGGQFLNIFASAFRGSDTPNPLFPLLALLFFLGGFVCYIAAVFSMRTDLENYYNSTENIGLHLSGVMTFFFAVYYFQYHFSRIAKWKKTGVLTPQ
jgi:hypothetical protein